MHNLLLLVTKLRNDCEENYVGSTSRCGYTCSIAYYKLCKQSHVLFLTRLKTISVFFLMQSLPGCVCVCVFFVLTGVFIFSGFLPTGVLAPKKHRLYFFLD